MTKIGNYTSDKLASMITLFKAVPEDTIDEIAMASLEDCISNGFIFVNVYGQPLSFVAMSLFTMAKNGYGIDKKINNQTFWKSFERVRDMDPREYVMNQIAHYFSTYGMEMIGLKARTYVPVQDFDIPDGILPFKRMTVIRFVSHDDMIELINHYAITTTAPSILQIEQFRPLMEYLTIKADDIKSFELQVIKHDIDGTVPTAPQSFLRYLVYKTIGSTLLIKNRATCRTIRDEVLNCRKVNIPYKLLSKANAADLATIFFRYKPIFLAFKEFPGCAPIINHIRRLADKYHVPMSDVSVQNFINLVLQDRTDDMAEVIERASNRELVKLNNFLSATMKREQVPKVYNIRNGRTFVRADAPTYTNVKPSQLWDAYYKVYFTLCKRLKKIMYGKKFYIPDYISYTAPISEKQLVGNLPWGTSLSTFNSDEAFTTGISWVNQNNYRTDIDLHLNSATCHFGWNGRYTDSEDIIFTGDQTDAPEPSGAAEAYYFKPGNDTYVLSASLYSGYPNTSYKMFMTSRKPLLNKWKDYRSDYIFNPADAMFAPIPLKFNDAQGDMTIGVFHNKHFFFYGGSVNRGVVPSANYADYIKGLTAKFSTMLDLAKLLVDCGASVLNDEEYNNTIEDERKDIISLAPEDLTATTLLDIIDGNI